MAWTYSLVFLVVGIGVGILISRLMNPQVKQQKNLQQELDKSKYELEQYRQELVDHFASSASLLDSLAKDYSKLYQHMAKTSSELMPNLPEQDNPFAGRITSLTEVTKSTDDNTQPKDYANGATGLLKDEPSAAPESEEEKVAEPKAS